MRAVVQRVVSARVAVAGEVVGQIEAGLVAFVGAGHGDDDTDLDWLAKKLVELRIFEDERGKMSRSVVDVGGGVLIVSQFTLFADTSRGNRPGFSGAMAPEPAREMVDRFVARVRQRVPRVETGRFGADMQVDVANDGPVTIVLDSRAR